MIIVMWKGILVCVNEVVIVWVGFVFCWGVFDFNGWEVVGGVVVMMNGVNFWDVI